MKNYLLDASALYRFLIDGPGANTVSDLFKEARQTNHDVSMSVVNWGEVYYNIMKSVGRAKADQVMDAVDGLPLTIWDADLRLTRVAADIRASYGLHYADCFAAALAGDKGYVVTTDAKDFRKVPWVKLVELPSRKQ